ncbi:unnamed protein product [Blepharisma stoltei]|uniref:Uncharacterized protein n=1 Tax=Blepharisma stoltei TaxID=1481888 RepID=A0AAU9KCT6_9CILI|nr:unnamed protein product [Blepharisma stoltei]
MSEVTQASCTGEFDKNSCIFSPKPKRTSIPPIRSTIENPFCSMFQEDISKEEAHILNELNSILMQPEVKRPFKLAQTPSPAFCRSQRPLSRHTSNPMINDVLFEEINSNSCNLPTYVFT